MSRAAERRRGGERALKTTARAVLRTAADWDALPAPIHHEIDVEGHADPQQERQGDDVGEIKRQADQDRRRQRQQSRQQQRRERHQNVAHRLSANAKRTR